MDFHAKLIKLLKTDPRFVDDEGELVVAAVQGCAWQCDRGLVKLLLSDKAVKAKFFFKVAGHWVFDFKTFLDYVSRQGFLDNSYTRFRNRIGLTVGDKFLRERGEVALAWPYKDCVLEGGQTKEEERRKELFFNEVLAPDEITRLLAPKVLTRFARYTPKGEEKVEGFRRDEDGTIRENLLIKGNNLVALHTLKEQFRGKVKLIYIDPPYNTGNDSFGYNDRFNHSSWLTFIKNRLDVAKGFLSPSGSIWINIGDEEAHYLKVLGDEVFGKENFVRNIVWQKRTSPDTRASLGDGHDHILVFAKDIELFKSSTNRLPKSAKQIAAFKNPDNDPKGPWVSSDFTAQGFRPNQMYKIVTPGGAEYYPPKGVCWKTVESVFQRLVGEGRIWFGKDGKGVPRRKTYLNESGDNAVWSWWTKDDVGHNQEAKKESIALFGADAPFATPKPERLLHRIIHIASNPGDTVLDFFAGSGTSLAVAHKMKRQYIGIEQIGSHWDAMTARLIKVVGKQSGNHISVQDDNTYSRRNKGQSKTKTLQLLAGESKTAYFPDMNTPDSPKINFDEKGVSKIVNWQGGGDFITCELLRYNEAYMDRIQAAETGEELLRIWEDMAENSFLKWYVRPDMPEEAVEDFKTVGEEEGGLDKQKHLLAELLDKNQFYVHYTEMEDEDYRVSEEDKALNRDFYGP